MSLPGTAAVAEERGKRAVVLSGGGADGAYGVGVLKALLNGRSPATGYQAISPDIFAGTSIGSFNAAFMVAHWAKYGAASVGELDTVWLDRLANSDGCSNGAFRIRADPRPLLRPSCVLTNLPETMLQYGRDGTALSWEAVRRLVHFVSTDEGLLQRTVELFNFASWVSREPWSRTIRETIDFQAIRESDRELRVVATNWSTGALRTFSNSDMGELLGPKAIEASSALPGFFQPVTVGSQVYVDGGVLQNTPLTPAIAAGATEIHIVYLDPDVKSVPLADEENTLETLYRMQQIAWASSVKADIQAARRVNEMLEILRDPGATVGGVDPIVSRLVERYSRFRPISIHRFSPREELGGALGLLNLDRPRIEGLIQQGFEDTVEHNCSTNRCILAHPDTTTPWPGTSVPDTGPRAPLQDPWRNPA